MSKRVLFGLGGIAVAGVLGVLTFAWRPAIAPIDPPAPSAFPRERVAKGEMLASVGNCTGCHTVKNGQPFAGGYGLPTPFGIIHSTNITPDPATGIGRWSEAAFTRAMREGVARDGSHLFPAFPFDHFAKLTDDDVAALYAYLMTLPPVKAPDKANTVPFPLNIRALQALWKEIYFHKGTYQPDAAKSPQWNRGAYLVEGLSHCGACHTPRNLLGAEQVGHPFAGALVEGWIALPLDVTPSPVRWTKDELVTYLRTGTSERHGSAFGPMWPIIQSLGKLPDSDIQAIAVYLADINRWPERAPDAVAATATSISRPLGDQECVPDSRLYTAACSSCHDTSATPPPEGWAELALNTSIWINGPHNFIRVVLDGIGPGEGAPGATMPGFRDDLSDADIACIGDYLRRTRTTVPSWPFLKIAVKKMREDPLSFPWDR